MKYAYLENTTPGHNKFYSMEEDSGGLTFTVKYARIGSATIQTANYSMSKWNATYNQKIAKGYVDKTSSHPLSPNPLKVNIRFTPNIKHVDKLNTVLNVLNANKKNISGSSEMIRYTNAVLRSIEDAETLEETEVSKEDMIRLNDIWTKIKHYAK